MLFCCLKLICNKRYMQANGLKYHTTHGLCHLQAAEASVDVSVAYNILSEGEEVEREAESRLRLFICDVSYGQQGYKKMAGLPAPAQPRDHRAYVTRPARMLAGHAEDHPQFEALDSEPGMPFQN
ncbi:hypothetical protein FIBSPDRAFT_1053184 [Athelia psychrophila]|uniref:C2H2-type domain-containing protein n=1 Tax=Athelia psychrophila TaxID=1759441 RepID=A0A167XCU6_9AGAM|nr:hypothetical protein FIBSPDRAFT_1053184 [Fibularhizoctonia sp. CBS 109695]